jgi:hypothetical protein
MDHQLEIKCVYVCVCVCVRCVCRRHRPTESSFGNKVGRVRFLQQPFLLFPSQYTTYLCIVCRVARLPSCQISSAVVRVK